MQLIFIRAVITAYLYRREFTHKILFSGGFLYFYLKMCFASHVADFAAK